MRIEYDELKEIAGVSAEDICEEAYQLLEGRKWNVTRSGIAKNIDAWLAAKSDKIIEMTKSPYYNGNLQLVIPAKIKRSQANNEASNILGKIYNLISITENKCIDGNGKNARDYLAEGCNIGKIVSPYSVKENSLHDLIQDVSSKYNSNLENYKSISRISMMRDSISYIRYTNVNRITQDLAGRLNVILSLDKKKITKDQKASRVVSRILHMSQNYDEYNKLFTKYADLINENIQSGYYVVSLNFLDYLRMSDGNSWSSCQTTDYTNTRHMDNTYRGMHCQGCLSYAEDEVSYVTYFIGADSDIKHADRNWKIYRTMFHVNNDKSIYVQGRVYPQSNDKVHDIYDTMKELFDKTMNLSDMNFYNYTRELYCISSSGAHYRDYDEFDTCRMFVAGDVSSLEQEDCAISIGSSAYSCYDGHLLSNSDSETII